MGILQRRDRGEGRGPHRGHLGGSRSGRWMGTGWDPPWAPPRRPERGLRRAARRGSALGTPVRSRSCCVAAPLIGKGVGTSVGVCVGSCVGELFMALYGFSRRAIPLRSAASMAASSNPRTSFPAGALGGHSALEVCRTGLVITAPAKCFGTGVWRDLAHITMLPRVARTRGCLNALRPFRKNEALHIATQHGQLNSSSNYQPRMALALKEKPVLLRGRGRIRPSQQSKPPSHSPISLFPPTSLPR